MQSFQTFEELGCVCSQVSVHSARVPFPVFESSPGHGVALVTLSSALVYEQQELNIAFCKEWRKARECLAPSSEEFVCFVPGLSRNQE